MPKFFKTNPNTNILQECELSEDAQFVEIYWNWTAFAVPMVLNLKEAVEKYDDRFEKGTQSGCLTVISPSIWFALYQHNKQYCSDQEANFLSKASLAIRPK